MMRGSPPACGNPKPHGLVGLLLFSRALTLCLLLGCGFSGVDTTGAHPTSILLHSLLCRLPALPLHLLTAPWWDQTLGGGVAYKEECSSGTEVLSTPCLLLFGGQEAKLSWLHFAACFLVLS